MDVTAQLLKVFHIDKQYRGLQTRLKAAERFLADQSRQLEALAAKSTSLDAQLRQLSASVSNDEGESARLEAKMAALREQMNSAQTNREYKAFLTELNTLKADREKSDSAALEHMTKIDELKQQLADLDAQKAERVRVRDVAASDRDQRAAEIKDRLAELKSQRDAAAADVPADALRTFEELLRTRGDDAMAQVEEQDRKRHEFTCGACMMSLPIESVNALLRSGKLTRCSSCSSLLYISEELAKDMLEGPQKGKRGSKSSSL